MVLGEKVEAEPPSWFRDGGKIIPDFSPQVMLIIACSIFAFIGAAIRLTRVSIASTVESFHTYIEPDDGVRHKLRKLFSLESWKGHWLTFWGSFPRRVWNFYIDALLIPSYRKEWGKYTTWSFRSKKRPTLPPQLKAEIRRLKKQKQAEIEKAKEGPKPVAHDHTGCARVIINVAGLRYETQLRTLQRYPDTLLGNETKRLQFFDPVAQQYYFDRNRLAFEAILYYYQSGGRFRRSENVPPDVLLEDALFFQLSQSVIDQYRADEGLIQSMNRDDIVPLSLFRRKIWLLFDFPENSLQAAVVGSISIMALFLSIAVFCVESIEDLDSIPAYTVNKTGALVIDYYDPYHISDPFFFTETVCNIWFILEFLARLICCPVLSKFLKSPLNVIDGIALVPYFVTVAPLLSGGGVSRAVTAAESLYLLRIVRISRVFRIFRLSRHSKALKILGKSLKASMNEMLLLIFFIALGVIFFASTMYFAELDEPDSQFQSIVGGFWWALITITTVGFGDVVPITLWGKVVGTFCAIAGVLTIALPVPVIVANFNYFYQQAIEAHDFRWININHVASCPYRPQGFKPVRNYQVISHHKQKHHHHHQDRHSQHHDNLDHEHSYSQFELSEPELKKYDRKRAGSQLHLQESIMKYAKLHQDDNKHRYSSDEEFGKLKKGRKC